MTNASVGRTVSGGSVPLPDDALSLLQAVLAEALAAASGATGLAYVEAVEAAVTAFTDGRLRDDLAVVAVLAESP